MGYAAGYRSGYLGGYLSEAASPFVRVQAPSSRPQITFEIAFENFGEPLTWIDESEHVAAQSPGISVHRGRSGELDEFNAGTASVLLRNEDGRFDPANADGPYFGKLVPRRQVRIGVKVGRGTPAFTLKRSAVGGDDVLRGFGPEPRPITIFRGDSGSFQRSWGIEGRTATVLLEAVDHSQRLDTEVPQVRDPITNQPLDITVHGTTGDAIVQLLTRFGWPGMIDPTTNQAAELAPLRNEFCDIDKGTATLVDYTSLPEPGVPISGSYLSALRQLATTEGGSFFISREGKATFQGKDHQGVTAGTWGDTEGLNPYHDVRSRPADEVLINDVTVHQDSGAEAATSDPESIAAYGRFARTWTIYTIDDPDLRALELLERYSQPRERIVGLQPLGRRDVGLWRSILPHDFGDRIRFQLHPVYNEPIDALLTLEGISISSPDSFDWTVDWAASETPELKPNLLPIAVADFEEGTTDWVADLGTADAIIPDVFNAPILFGLAAPSGAYVLRCIDPSKTTNDLEAHADVDLASIAPELILPGTSFRVGGSFFNLRQGSTFSVEWLDAFGAVADSDEALLPTAHAWRHVFFDTTCPLTGVSARLRLAGPDNNYGVFADALFMREL